MRTTLPWLAGVIAATLAGCSSGSTMSVSTAVKTGSAALVAGPSATASPTFSKLYLVVKQLELKKAPVADTSGSSGTPTTPKEVREIEIGPFVLQIDLTSTALQVAVPDVTIDPGTYSGVEFEIHKVRPGEPLNYTPTASQPDLVGKSMALAVSCADKTFIFSTMEVEAEYESPITIGPDAAKNVTISFATSAWLAGPGGTTLDPCVPADEAQIFANVRNSIQAFGDDNHDGEQD
jgi:hypothetical protein